MDPQPPLHFGFWFTTVAATMTFPSMSFIKKNDVIFRVIVGVVMFGYCMLSIEYIFAMCVCIIVL